MVKWESQSNIFFILFIMFITSLSHLQVPGFLGFVTQYSPVFKILVFAFQQKVHEEKNTPSIKKHRCSFQSMAPFDMQQPS